MHATPLTDWHLARGAAPGNEPTRYGDPAAEYRAALEAAGLFDATASRDRLLVTGGERVDFVQGLCSNDLEKLAVGGSLEAAFITPKGRLLADARLTKLEDALLVDVEGGRGEVLSELFAKYRIHEDVEWGDASEDLAALELWGPKAADALGEPLAEGTSAAVTIGEHTLLAVGTPFGAVLYVPAAIAPDVASGLASRLEGLGGRVVGREAVDARRIELGLGRYGVDWGETTNPLEAGLDRALDYKKGCYVGQEVVAKATYVGHVNRRLVRLEWEGAPVAAGTELIGGRAPGRVTSCAPVPGTGRVVALGVVRRDVACTGTKVRVGEAGPEATVLGFPFRSKEKPVC